MKQEKDVLMIFLIASILVSLTPQETAILSHPRHLATRFS
jgi:hypothetical protein